MASSIATGESKASISRSFPMVDADPCYPVTFPAEKTRVPRSSLIVRGSELKMHHTTEKALYHNTNEANRPFRKVVAKPCIPADCRGQFEFQ